MASNPKIALIRHLEECSLKAWPAFRTLQHAGYILRLSGGYTNRANSVNSYSPPPYTFESFEEVRKYSESVFSGEGIPTVFRITPLLDPRVDTHLENAGYERLDNTMVMMTLPFSSVDVVHPARVQINSEPTDQWLEAFATMSNHSQETSVLHEKILKNIEPNTAYASISSSDGVVACGVGVLDSGTMGIFDVLVTEGSRGKGYGKDLMLGLIAWGKQFSLLSASDDNGAGPLQGAYLMVGERNATARKLYEGLRFEELYRYHYRRKAI